MPQVFIEPTPTLDPIVRFEQLTEVTPWRKTGALDLWIENSPSVTSGHREGIEVNKERFAEWRDRTEADVCEVLGPADLNFSPILARVLGEYQDEDLCVEVEDWERVSKLAERQPGKFTVVSSATNPDIQVVRFAVGSLPSYPAQASTHRSFLEVLPLEGGWEGKKSSLERVLGRNKNGSDFLKMSQGWILMVN